MNRILTRISANYDYMWSRHAGTIISVGTLGGAIYSGTLLSEGPTKPKFGDTALFTVYGALTGAASSLFLLATYPVAIPVTAFVGPIHMYNKHKFESKQQKARSKLK